MRPLVRSAAYWIAAGGLLALLVNGCGQRIASGGGDATETGNARVAGVIVREDGRAMSGAEVLILPKDYNPVNSGAVPDSQKDTTDALGGYRFTRLAPGRYNVQVNHPISRTRSFILDIRLAEDSVIVPQDTLHPPGILSVPLPETSDSGSGYVYIPGTTFRTRINSEIRIEGRVVLDSLPAGLMPVVVYVKAESDPGPILLATDVRIRKNETTFVNAYDAWPNSARLVMNTSASGVAIGKDQHGFPMLVRLSAPAFDFSKTAPGGADLRFAKADGMPLPREIEYWDPVTGKAAIWVRLDTLRAGSASQYITMHWGKAEAGRPWYRTAVFDTLSGIAGVWHLGEEAADTIADGIYRDATGAGNHGNDRVTSVSVDGIVGAGHGFDFGDYIQTPQVKGGLGDPRSFTISIWYRTDGKGLGLSGGELVNVGDNYGLRILSDSIIHFWYWPPLPPAGAANDWYQVDVKRPEVFDGNWHLVAGSFDGARLRLFLDGKEIGNAPAPDIVGFLFPVNMTIGKHGNGQTRFEYRGDLDEAEIHSVSRDSDWIKLTFENQKPESPFPVITGP